MFGLGTIVNTIAVIAGGIIGIFFKNFLLILALLKMWWLLTLFIPIINLF